MSHVHDFWFLAVWAAPAVVALAAGLRGVRSAGKRLETAAQAHVTDGVAGQVHSGLELSSVS